MSIKGFSSFPLPATRGATCYLKSSLGRESVLLASEASSNLQYLKNGVHYVRAKRAPIPNSCQVEYTTCERSEPPSQTLARWSTLRASKARPHPKHLPGVVRPLAKKLESLRGQIPPVSLILPKTSYNVTVAANVSLFSPPLPASSYFPTINVISCFHL